MSTRAILFDIGFDLLEPHQVHEWIATRNAHSNFAYIVTPNVDHVVRLETAGPELHRTYSQAALCLCDSRILMLIARLLGIRLTLVPGSDLVSASFNHILRPRDRVCLIGGGESHKASLMRLYPGLEVVQHIPPMGLQNNMQARISAIDFAENSGARIILLAVGSPQQELLAGEMAQRPGIKGTAMCIGAAVDFIVGERRRAPHLLRRAGMEWAWRLGTEPRRLARRYLVDGPKILPMAWRWWRADYNRSEVNRAR